MDEEFKSNMHDMKNLHIYRTISKYYSQLENRKYLKKIPESYKKYLLISIVLEISSTKYLDDICHLHTYTLHL